MILVEALKIRWWMLWWGAAVLLIGLALGIAVEQTGVVVNGTRINGVTIPLVVIAPVAMFFAMIFATSAGLSLNREAETIALSWTKPVSRTVVALRIVAVDCAALVVMYAFAWLVALGVLAAANAKPEVSAAFPTMLVLSLGVALMWYALCQLLTAGFASGSRSIVGFLWPVALVMSGLGTVGGAFGAVVLAINVFNPLAYLNHISSRSEDLALTGYWQAPIEERALAVWVLAALMTSAAIAIWNRREA